MPATRWTIDDDARLFAARGVPTHLGTDLDAARQRMAAYPSVAAHALVFWRTAAQLLGAQMWGQTFDVLPTNPFVKAEFDISCGTISVEDRVLARLETLLDDDARTVGVWMRNEVAVFKQDLGAIFHEMSHAAGPGDRRRYVTERIATNEDDRAQMVLEGFTELRVERDIDAFIDLSGIAARLPGIHEVAYINHYPAEVAFAKRLIEGLAAISGSSEVALLDSLAPHGYSLRAVGDMVVACAAAAGHDVGPRQRADAVGIILDAMDSVRWNKTQTRSLPTWDDYCAQVGRAAGDRAIEALNSHLTSVSASVRGL